MSIMTTDTDNTAVRQVEADVEYHKLKPPIFRSTIAAIFFGPIGLHRFAAGKYKSGLVWLGVTALIALLILITPWEGEQIAFLWMIAILDHVWFLLPRLRKDQADLALNVARKYGVAPRI